MKKIKAAVVGLGRIASLLEDDSLREKPCTHAGAIAANPECVLAAGSDISRERRALFAQRWKVPVYSDAGQMLFDHHPDLLVIAVHPDSHAFYCRLAAKHGVPVLICEKPLADSLSAAREIAALESSGALRIVTNHERRYSQDYIRAKKILDDNILGKLLSVNAAIYMGKTKRLIDVLWHDGTHLADALMYLTGRVMKHRKTWGAKLTAREGTAWISGLLVSHPAAPVPFVIETGAERDHLVFEIEFSCEKGRLRIGNGIFEVWESAASPYAENFRSLRRTGEVFEGNTGYFANMLKDAAACVRDPERKPLSSAADGLQVILYLNSVKKWRGSRRREQ
jgi:predicted dehydrogenase